MPRKTAEKRPPAHETAALAGYWSRHPEEKEKADAQADARDERARLRRLAKYRPELLDMEDDGKWVEVAFVRNGEKVYGTYILKNLEVPSNFHKLELRRADRFAARVAADEAREKLLREQGKTPQT